ncbi:hypothetical protein STENOSP10_28910 [Stenotrophomonas sepilia]|uniref:Uncharacterized protein n=1 Tax=Stenotrophomonas sepilia TaxID=2860290 RepID=A0ABQ6QF59_9GAMM|nr:hypothetical protein STENOSP10_28910 [Stenotrophomonas sepilia]
MKSIHAWPGSTVSTKVDTYQQPPESVGGGAVSECGVSAAWMRLPSLHGRTCSVPALRHRPTSDRFRRLLVGVDLGRHGRSRPCVDALHSILEIFDFDGDSSAHGVDPRQIAGLCRRRGGSGCGGVSRMGPRHASGGLGRTPNPGLAVCAGKRTRASGDRAYMGEGALLATHCFASARTHSRQRLGRAPEGYLQRPPPPDPPRHPTECTLLLLPWRLPASGRHYRRCRAQPGRTPPTGSRRPERVPYAAIR